MATETHNEASVDSFFERPIVNGPFAYPDKHWELDESGQPTGKLINSRRGVDFVTPIPKPKKTIAKQQALDITGEGLDSQDQSYDVAGMINEVRRSVDQWREIKDKNQWRVTPETARLLEHWRSHDFTNRRPFFCQVEAVETLIWLTEVAPGLGKQGAKFTDYLNDVNEGANPGLSRLALKLATGAGKTTVMAMVIAWQTINAVRHPSSKRFTRGFLVVTPGITIRDRLRVLQPNDPDSYYESWELVPREYLQDLEKAKIVITNYHSFKLRDTLELSKAGRRLLQGHGPEIRTLETEGQMLQRVMPELMGMKNILAINDEAHHCYREKPGLADKDGLKGDDKKEADKNREAARLWINGLSAVDRKLGLSRVLDLSATPFFLQGSGYAEGTLFPWVMSDFSLMDAIECGIVKLPRVPVSDNIPGAEMPKFRNLWEHIGPKMPKKGRGASGALDPKTLPPELQTALSALYGHYAKTFDLWEENDIGVPPCFIVVCNNTAASKLVYDYISGYVRTDELGDSRLIPGELPLFSNFDEHGNPLARQQTLLIDSEQLESGEALDKGFRDAAAAEIENFRKEKLQRTGDQQQAATIKDEELLREVMNTVGSPGRLGESVRCVVSVSMLTEGWDTNTVTHVLGVRAFGTQLLCEQVVGRALRRQSYDLEEDGLFAAEYADVLGIPFDFTAKPVPAPPRPPRKVVQVKAVSPERDDLEITFPRVLGYRTEGIPTVMDAVFDKDSVLVLDPNRIGPSKTRNEGIVGESAELTLDHTGEERLSTIVYRLTYYLLEKRRRPGEELDLNQFGALKRIVRRWVDECLECKGGVQPAQVLYREVADDACERIEAAITATMRGEANIRPVLDPFNPLGSSRNVNFMTSKPMRWESDPRKSHVNIAVCDSTWELELCRVLESHPRVNSYVRNQSLGFEVPYALGSVEKRYLPDFIARLDDGHGANDPLNLVLEVKGYRGEDAKSKANTVRTKWLPAVNGSDSFGRWEFVELEDVFEMESEFATLVEQAVAAAIEHVVEVSNREIESETFG